MKKMNVFRRFGTHLTAGAGLSAFLPVAAFAQTTGTDYSSITSGIDWSSAVTAILGVAGLLALALAAKKGARLVLSMISR
ncbi:hypothetical protein [Salinisphaera hydrothermalis]|uniref:hypothetical protein n=1 Tax=Salinisphaera hydrothermalis TaxID=563188 RepID=UPI0033423304